MAQVLMIVTFVGLFSVLLCQPAEYWFENAQLTLQNALKEEKLNQNVARNVILFLGDGMSIPTVTAARMYKGEQNGHDMEEGFLSWETFPHFGLSKTYNTDAQVPDSAGTATAFLSGVKTKSGVIGLDDNAEYGLCETAAGNEADSIFKMARDAGKSVGIVTTARITHATPSAAYAHTPARVWECDDDIPSSQRDCKDIALQFLENIDIQVALGGGRKKFIPKEDPDPEYPSSIGERDDDRDLIQEWVSNKSELGAAKYVWEKKAFDAIDPANVDYLLGLFEDSHMQFHTHPDAAGEPTLAEMTEKAILILQKNPNGFVLLVEAGRIDHGHHYGQAHLALTDTLALDEAVTMAKTLTNDQETLTVVTADHSHVMAVVGYPSRGNPILGLSDEDGVPDKGTDQLPYTTLIYANGPGGMDVMNSYQSDAKERPNITNEDTLVDSYRQQAIVPLYSETHGGDDVGIWADGPMAHLFHSTHEQHYIMHVMAYASCLDADKLHCAAKKKSPSVAEILKRHKV